MRARRVARAAAIVVALGACAACKGKVTPAECTEMLDRYVDMSIAADPELAKLPPAQSEAVREMKRALKKAEPSYAQVQGQCEGEVTRKEYDCAMKAKSPNDWEACIE